MCPAPTRTSSGWWSPSCSAAGCSATGTRARRCATTSASTGPRPRAVADVPDGRGPLHGLRVVEAATLAAGPMVATTLGEFGAEVVKVEQPGSGDPMRTWGDRRDGIGLAWKSVSRNKRCVTLDLRQPEAQELLHRMLDVSGYGRGGPKSDRPGYGTLAEAMSGFAHVTGQPDGPPTLPPFMLADGVAALAATYAVIMALYHRDVHGGGGQLVDVNLIEPLARLIETQTLAFDQLGVITQRAGNRLDASAPRNAYRTADDHWLAISSASPSIAVRLFRAIDRPDLADDPAYVDPVRRRDRAVELDTLVAKWVGERTLDEAMRVFEAAELAAAPVYDAQQLVEDEHLRARGTFVTVDDPDLGPTTVQAPVAVLTDTPGRVEHLGRALGADNDAVFGGLLGVDPDRIAALRAAGII